MLWKIVARLTAIKLIGADMTRKIPQLYREKDLLKIRNARDMFVQGVANDAGELEFPSVASLVGIAGVSKPTLYKIAEREDWKGDRVRVQMAIRSKRDADHAALAVREGNACDELCIKAAKLLLKEVVRRAAELDANGLDPEGNRMKSATGLRLSATVVNAQKIIKLAIGEPTEINGDFTDDETVRSFEQLLDGISKQRAEISRALNSKVEDASAGSADSTT